MQPPVGWVRGDKGGRWERRSAGKSDAGKSAVVQDLEDERPNCFPPLGFVEHKSLIPPKGATPPLRSKVIEAVMRGIAEGLVSTEDTGAVTEFAKSTAIKIGQEADRAH